MIEVPPLPESCLTPKDKAKVYSSRNRARKKLLNTTPAEQLVEATFRAGKAAGCPRDQIENFIKAGRFLQPKQLEMAAAARSCDFRCLKCEALYQKGLPMTEDCPDCGATAVGVGGARGGGKSDWMFTQICADDVQRFPGLKVLYLRKSVTAAREQIRGLLLSVCKGIKHNYREQAGTIEFPNGSYIVVKHFKDEKDIENFLGQEYDVIAIEELTTLTFDKWKNLMTCLRTSKQGWRPRFYGAWNWGGVGHFWTMKVFYEPWEKKQERQTRYILARVDDNKFNNPEYINTLKSLTGWKYKSWYLGDPHFQSGQFFTNWNEACHVYPNKNVNPSPVMERNWYASYDYGFSHPFCFLLHFKDAMGNSYTIDEEHATETVINEQSESFKAMLRRHNVDMSDLHYIAAGKDCFSRKQDGRTIAMDFEDNGITLTPTEIDRVNAWAVMQQRLGDIEKGIQPTWFIHNRCVNLISQIPMAQNHETRIGDIAKMNADENGDGGDDALECARNYLVSEPSGVIRFARPVALSRTPFQQIGFI
jgi:hypothetical protein